MVLASGPYSIFFGSCKSFRFCSLFACSELYFTGLVGGRHGRSPGGDREHAAPAPAAASPPGRRRGLRASLGRARALRWWYFSPGALLLLAVYFAPPLFSPAASRSLEAAANFSAQVADAGGTMAQAAKNFTLLASDVAVSFTRGGLAVAEEAWDGVDLHNATVNASGARFCVRRGVTRSLFESSPLASSLNSLPPQWKQVLWAAVHGVDERFPRFAALESHFHTGSSYEMFEYEVRILPHAYVGIRFVWAELSFEASWANPLWEILGADVTAQLEKIGARVQSSINQALDLEWLRRPLQDSEAPSHVVPPMWFSVVSEAQRQLSWVQFASGSGP